VVPVPRRWHQLETSQPRPVTVLWPPAHAGGYTLIVDGVAAPAAADGETHLDFTPSRAVLHRRGTPLSKGVSACNSDCIPLFPV
jgi:hypothetical protein